MIHAYSDVSMDADMDLMSVGYILFESSRGTRTKIDSGAKVIHTDEDDRDIEWNTAKGEFFSAIIAVRAAQEQVDNESSEMIIVHLDNRKVANDIRKERWVWEPYFRHTLNSFIERFGDYDVEYVDRENNYRAHEQAQLGLRVGRDLLSRQGSLG